MKTFRDIPFKSMLAGKVKNIEELRYPVLASPKLDGIRFHIIGGVVVSRNLLPFKNLALQKKFGKKKYNGLDGEIMCGAPTDAAAFRKSAVVNSINGDIGVVTLHVFDDFTNPGWEFRDRLIDAHQRIMDVPGFTPVDHYYANNSEELSALEESFLELGYEGLMVRDAYGPYKHGRSTTREGWLLKLKRFEDSEAVIDDVEELMHNANEKTLTRGGKAVRNTKKEGKVGLNRLGAYHVRDIHTGVAFRVGSGFTDAERMDLWDGANLNIGKVIKYRYFPTGSKSKPRFPVFLGFREDI